MTGTQKIYILAAGLLLACGLVVCLGIFGPGVFRLLTSDATPVPDYEATLQVLIPEATASGSAAAVDVAPLATEPTGHIVFTCQIYRDQSSEQICIMNADGTAPRQLTQETDVRHYYPSLAPDGQSVVYSQFSEENVFEVYEMRLADGVAARLTERLGVLTGPEISPDGSSIAFMRWTQASDQYQLWVMDRDGGNPRRLLSGTGWDPTWSPDGNRLLFASDLGGTTQLYTVDRDGADLRRITDLPALRGRSDWSPQGLITTYSGEPWRREVYLMQADGSDVRPVSPAGGNSQGPSFSPDGQWIAFTGYFDMLNDIHGCEIYVIRVDGSGLRRLTNNAYCDYQPRWGP